MPVMEGREGLVRLATPSAHDYELRHPTLDDVRAVAGVIEASDLADIGARDYPEQQLQADWESGVVDLGSNAWVVASAGGPLVAVGVLFVLPGSQIDGFGRVHPEHRRRGVGRLLLRRLEARAEEILQSEPDRPRSYGTWAHHTATDARELLESEGYRAARSFFRMTIDLDEPPPEPDWPEGIEIRTFRAGEDDRATFEAVEEAFQDHWGRIRREYETWRKRRIEQPDFDPSLWHLAIDGGRIVGFSLCDVHGDENWVSTVGVLRRWRQRGLGIALMRHSFREFQRRGRRTIVLTVDAESPTGATRLYERVGMRVERQYDYYAKELASAVTR